MNRGIDPRATGTAIARATTVVKKVAAASIWSAQACLDAIPRPTAKPRRVAKTANVFLESQPAGSVMLTRNAECMGPVQRRGPARLAMGGRPAVTVRRSVGTRSVTSTHLEYVGRSLLPA